MSTRTPQPDPRGRAPDGSPPRDELDNLLRQWHAENAERAAAGRDVLLARLAEERKTQPAAARAPGLGEALLVFLALVRNAVMSRYSPVAATAIALIVVIAVLLPSPSGPAFAQEIMVPDGGRLDALDDEGNILGPCPLEHTDVDAQISGFIGRVTVTQKYRNPYKKKIEAVYTFPLSAHAAVDRMTMTIGDRVVEGEVKERELARRIYEAAREQGYVASLLEQERPNIFTQSVANLEPQAQVTVQISYVEVLTPKNGTYSFDFPMVVGPRYIPGASVVSPSVVPAELEPRPGLVLLGPAGLTVGAAGKLDELGSLQAGKLAALIDAAQPVKYPGDAWWGRGDVTGGAGQPTLWYRFEATYCDGSKELGELYTDGTGRLNGRWFYVDPRTIEGMGSGFAPDTNQVPDASRITPMPVKPPTRAGHDISVTVNIDTGGPGLVDVESPLHKIVMTPDRATERADGRPRDATITLAAGKDIPNRDFVLTWRETADTIQEATFTHATPGPGDATDGFFTLILQPPDRVEAAEIRPRELIFVMDTSGSMNGLPIEKSKEVMARAIGAMRPEDTFNVITFAGTTDILWDEPRPATTANRTEARAFVESRRGRGGTEMMTAINNALVQPAADAAPPLSPRALADLPADGRRVDLAVGYERLQVLPGEHRFRIPLEDDLSVAVQLAGDLPPVYQPRGVTVRMDGVWRTEDGRRILVADRAWLEGKQQQAPPLRIVLFLTDGQVGNDMAIIDAVRRNAHTTRVFAFGIGDSVNRYLLENMATAGRGEVEFVLLNSNADEAVSRFTKRIETPVLTDIELSFSKGLDVADVLPSPAEIPDLFDAEPLVIHGRYRTPGEGTVTIRGRTGAGAYERTVNLDLPQREDGHDVIATLWARAKVDQVMAPHLQAIQIGNPPAPVRNEIVALGEQFRLLTQYTSFVAVEKSRMTIGGEPVLVAVPIELPEGTSYEGFFGGTEDKRVTGEIALGQTPRPSGLRTRSSGPYLGIVEAPAPLSAGRQPSAGYGKGGSGEAGKRLHAAKREAPGKGVSARLGAQSPAVPAEGMIPGEALVPQPTDAAAAGTGGGGNVPAARVERASGSADIADQVIAVPEPESAGRRDLALYDEALQAAAGLPLIDLETASAPAGTGKDLGLGPDEQAIIARDVQLLDVQLKAQGDAAAKSPARIALADEFFTALPAGRSAANRRPVLGQDAALLIAARVEQNRLEDARGLAESLVRIRPDYAVGLQMRDTLTDPSLDAKTVADRIAALGEKARKELQEADERWLHRQRLDRVIDPALRALTTGRPRVTVLVAQPGDVTTKALAEAGLQFEAASASLPIVVGRVDVANLEKLALLEAVRRIEPTRMEHALPPSSVKGVVDPE